MEPRKYAAYLNKAKRFEIADEQSKALKYYLKAYDFDSEDHKLLKKINSIKVFSQSLIDPFGSDSVIISEYYC